MPDRIGKYVRMTLQGDLHYKGKILFEDINTITILDKYEQEVCIGKASLVSMEVLS